MWIKEDDDSGYSASMSLSLSLSLHGNLLQTQAAAEVSLSKALIC